MLRLWLLSALAVVALGQGSSTSGTIAPDTGKHVDLPLHLPPYDMDEYKNVSDSLFCLLYLEGITVIVHNAESTSHGFANIDIKPGNASWSYTPSDVSCASGPVGDYSFTIRLHTTADLQGYDGDQAVVTLSKDSDITFQLTITADKGGYWKLSAARASSLSVKAESSSKYQSCTASGKSLWGPLDFVGLQSVTGFAWACSQTQAIWWNTDQENMKLGIVLLNAQIQPFEVKPDPNMNGRRYFTRNVDDCVGTFSPGSWMGIISALILFGGLIFGYLMLQSVQTGDRFDDPKHKQIVINVRE